MGNGLIVILALILLTTLLYLEKRGNRKGLLPTKTVLSMLFVVAALLQPHPLLVYYRFLLLGLLFCLVGDVFLALPQEKMFLAGLISFLLGHVCYVGGFFYVSTPSGWTLTGTLATAVISGGIYLWLKPHLGAMKFPVFFYVVVITVMLSGAWAVLGDSGLTRSGRIMVFTGALSFYFSDIFVARDRFLKNQFLNQLIGLPMYYSGQFLLAFSVGLLS